MKKVSETKSVARVQTWLAQLDNGNIKSAQLKVLLFIKEHPNCTLWDVRTHLGIAHQTASGRISTLLDEGIIKITGSICIDRDDISYSQLLFISSAEEQGVLRKSRRIEKQKTWAAYGMENFADLIPQDIRNWLDGNKIL